MERFSENGTILVVDDDPVSRLLLRKIFSGERRVLESRDGAEALRILRGGEEISAVILDLHMPVMDGFAVLEALRGDDALQKIPVVVATSNDDTEALDRALALGAIDVITKPFSSSAVLHRVNNLIRLVRSAHLEEENRWLSEKVRLSEIDPKTGLYNKITFCREVAHTLQRRSKEPHVLARWDLDGFKVFNDLYGTAAGDRLLMAIGQRFIGDRRLPAARGMLVYGHWDADHFVSLWDATLLEPEQLHRYTLAQLSAILPSYPFTIRLGLYRIDSPSMDVGTMCDRALLALRTAKNTYDQHIVWYDSSMRAKVVEEQEIVSSMKAALAAGEFVAYYQPQYNYDTGAISGAETLVRWLRPGKGVVSPGTFIPIFERNGFIFELDKAIWEQACAHLRSWLDEGLPIPSLSVNVSRRDLRHPELIATLRSLMEKYRLHPSLLHLEVTESAYMSDPAHLLRTVSELQESGFHIEMDDFGSGYSSLNALKDVPVNTLKLDMAFLSTDRNAERGGSILSSIVRMASSLDLPVIAEGVETQRQADYLKSIGSLFMQGYYFAKPMPSGSFTALLRQSGAAFHSPVFTRVGVDHAVDFLNATTQSTLLFNSFLGGAAILEYRDGQVAALRTNDRFYEAVHTTRERYAPYQYRLLDRLPPEEQAAFTAMLDSVIRTGDEAGLELRSLPVHPGGEPIWTHARCRCLAEKGGSYYFYLSVEDVTEHKKLELHNAELTSQLSSIINSIPGGVASYEVRPQGYHVLYLSDGVARLSGRTREEYLRVLNEEGRTTMYPPDAPLVNRAIRSAMDSGAEIDVNYRIPHQDGRLVWLNLRGRRMGEHNGYPVLYAVFHNLSVTTALFQQILGGLEDALLVADCDTREVLFANSAAERLAGHPFEKAGCEPCYRYLQRRDAPCECCMVGRLGDQPQCQEVAFSGRRFLSRVTRIDWNGRNAFINYLSERPALQPTEGEEVPPCARRS